MGIYKNQTGDTSSDVILVRKHLDKITISQITITCTHASNDIVIDRLYIDDGTNEYDIIHDLKIPLGATLILDQKFNFNYEKFDLKIKTSGSSNCSILIE
jgi:hypothetical protein